MNEKKGIIDKFLKKSKKKTQNFPFLCGKWEK